MDPLGRNNKLVEYSLYLACFLSNISQMPVFVRTGITQRLAFPGWILVALAVFLSRRVTIKKIIMGQITLGIMLLIWLLFDSLLISKSQFGSSLLYSYMISMFVFFLGSSTSNYVDDRVFRNINLVFVISMIIVTANIFVEYFGVGYNLSTRLYAYSSKNSVSQIIFTTIILLIVRIKSQKMIWKTIKIGAIAFEIYVLLLLRSRATLVSLLLCVLVLVFARNISKRIKAAVSAVGVLGIVILLTNNRFYDFIVNNVVFASRNISNLNDLTSGRVSIFSSFPALIAGNWFTGIGPTYFECFPLSAILQFGIIGGLLCIVISLQPLWKSFALRRVSEDWNLLFLISLGYSVNGFFEGLTPFGPGVKCYYMWLLFGILLCKDIIPQKTAQYECA